MAVCWWIIYLSWLFVPRSWIQIVMSTQLRCFQFFHLLFHIFFICLSLPLLSSASHNFWFCWPCPGQRLQNFLSQDGYSLWEVTIGRTLCPCVFPVETLGIFIVGFLFSRCTGVIVTSSSTFWSFSFKGVYPLSACTASLVRHSSIDLNSFLVFLFCVPCNLWIFTKPLPPLSR